MEGIGAHGDRLNDIHEDLGIWGFVLFEAIENANAYYKHAMLLE
jgi:hypothetical protein